MSRSTVQLTLVAAFLLLSLVKADWGGPGNWGDGNGDGSGPWGPGNGDWGSGNPWTGNNDGSDDDDTDSNSGSNTINSSNGFGLGSLGDFNRASKILIAHAVIASLAWVVFIPSGAILLRLGLKNPVVLKLHAFLQILSYFLYIVAAGMGIWLAQQTSQFGTWNDPHPRLGLAILAIAFFQPIFGAIHHRIFKKRVADSQTGKSSKAPGRTVVGRLHIWVGRSLIVLGMINGGLGIRLASFSPFQTDETTRKAKIAYGVVAAAMFLLYAILVIVFEVRRKRAQSTALVAGARGTAHAENAEAKLPSYDESQSDESLHGNGARRYQ